LDARGDSRFAFGRIDTVFSLSAAQRAIILAGCLGTAYHQLLLSPANVAYAHSLGATDLHIGILNALPYTTLFMQFVAAVVVNQLSYRRWVWMTLSVLHRLIFVPLTLCVWLVPDVHPSFWLWAFLLASAMNHAAHHFCSPLWLSWMGDYLPHEGLSHYWGVRQLWMHWAAAATLGGSAVLMYQIGLSAIPAFTCLATVGGVIGVIDVLLFLGVEEPRVTPSREPSLTQVVTEPFRNEGFRSYILYACYWNFAAMIAAPFISLYLLEHVGMSLYAVLLLWAASWVGGALVAGRWGHLCETFGHRPVLELCTMFKTINMLALLFLPGDPTWAFWILVPVFMGDQVLNSGIMIASNGYMLKHSPSENRTMYLAAGTALAGMFGGVTGIACGAALDGMHGLAWQLGGLTLTGFHVLFCVSTCFRLGAIALARGIDEPQAETTMTLVWHLLTGATPPPPAHWGELPVGSVGQTSRLPGAVIHIDSAAPAAVPTSHLPALVDRPLSAGATAPTRASP
jgi:hypothetical protein